MNTVAPANIFKFLLAAVIGVAVLQFPFYGLESLLIDARFRTAPEQRGSNSIVLIKSDEKTVRELGRIPNLVDYGLAISKLDKSKAKEIVLLLPAGFEKSTASEFAFLKNVSNTNNVSIASGFLPEELEVIKKSNLSEPFSQMRIFSTLFSSDKVSFAADDVSRRIVVDVNGERLLAPTISQKINFHEKFRGQFDYKGSNQVFTNFSRNGSFASLSLSDIVENKFDSSFLANKVILIGDDSNRDTDDYLKTPFNRDPLAMSKLEVLANMIETLSSNTGLVTPSKKIDLTLTILLSLFVSSILFRASATKGLLSIAGIAIIFCLVSWLLFTFFRVSINMAHPLLAIFINYYLFIPYRLIQESKKSWEYQQKNKLLTEVEQLKTNFLSMMSHDLKTPLARIQGMADVALAHSETLRPEQKQALTTISNSTTELTHFISSILDLSRIESEQVKLHLQSKDINAILEEVLAKYEFQAKEKNVTFIREFEPLFSIKVDVDLMKQVFSNLVENAIKYSPSGSKVLISTEEVNGHIQVQIADQGIGIPNGEINNIFAKFYRSSQVKNSPIKGSGLGLFLAKYFVELHKGEISVESEPQQGSTFTVNLPM